MNTVQNFRVGDRVRSVKYKGHNGGCGCTGTTGVVIERHGRLAVQYDSSTLYDFIETYEWELLSSETPFRLGDKVVVYPDVMLSFGTYCYKSIKGSKAFPVEGEVTGINLRQNENTSYQVKLLNGGQTFWFNESDMGVT